MDLCLFSRQRLERYLEDSIPAASDSMPLEDAVVPSASIGDVEDISANKISPSLPKRISVNKKKRKRNEGPDESFGDINASTWREALGPAPTCDHFDVRDHIPTLHSRIKRRGRISFCFVSHVTGVVSVSKEEMGLAESQKTHDYR